jgi:hypothetical protein
MIFHGCKEKLIFIFLPAPHRIRERVCLEQDPVVSNIVWFCSRSGLIFRLARFLKLLCQQLQAAKVMGDRTRFQKPVTAFSQMLYTSVADKDS